MGTNILLLLPIFYLHCPILMCLLVSYLTVEGQEGLEGFGMFALDRSLPIRGLDLWNQEGGSFYRAGLKSPPPAECESYLCNTPFSPLQDKNNSTYSS